jgi:signal transduction histidine kinase
MERMRGSVLRGLAAFRWLAWVWMATVLVLARGNLVAPVAAVVLVGVALGVTVWLTSLLRRAPERLVSARVVGVEVGVALALQFADGFVYRAGHVFTPEQPLGVAWPLASVMAAGVAFGPFVGAGTGLLLGAGRATSSTLNVTPDADPMWGVLLPEQLLSLVTTSVLFALAGGIAGYAIRLIVDAESRAAAAERSVASLRAREDVARRLHDGVLQTLAVVERRSDDPQLARLAREQERDLRSFLFEGPSPGVIGAGALGDALRAAADRYETAFTGRSEVLVPDDLPELDAEVVEAIAGAVGEALTNAGKHGAAARVVVYAEPTDEGVFVSVRDDGAGFDPAAVVEGVGLPRSIRGRIEEIGGGVEIAAAPGRGTEVRLTVPR